MKQHIINFRVSAQERESLDNMVNWINHEDQEHFRQIEFYKRWGHVSISHVLRWQLAKAHDVIQARISSSRKTKGSQLQLKRKTKRAAR